MGIDEEVVVVVYVVGDVVVGVDLDSVGDVLEEVLDVVVGKVVWVFRIVDVVVD